MRGRPRGSQDYKLNLTDNQKRVEAFLELARMGERCYQHPETKYLSTRNIAKWPFPVQPEHWYEYYNDEQTKIVKIKCGVDEFECLVRVYPRLIISKRDFEVVWKRVGGMGWRTIRQIDGREPEVLRMVYTTVLDQFYPELVLEHGRICF